MKRRTFVKGAAAAIPALAGLGFPDLAAGDRDGFGYEGLDKIIFLVP